LRSGRHGAVRETEEDVTVGFYAPLPPARTGVADYAAALLDGLRCLGPVEIAPERCDVALYHLGNNPLHAEIYRRSLERPGVVVLHDAVLHHFLLGQLDEQEYADEFVYNYGEPNRALAEELWRGRAASAADVRYFQFPLLKRAAGRARAVVVHNPSAVRAVKQHAPEAPVIEIPHLFMPSAVPGCAAIAQFRARLRLSAQAFVFGVFGYLRESKRLLSILETFSEVHQENPQTGLLVAGDFISSEFERAVAPLLGGPGIARVPFLSTGDFTLAISAVDACINLRYPAAGETSGITVRLMGMGKPVLVTDTDENAAFPEGACLRIAPGVKERDSLRQHMLLLPSVPELASSVGKCAAGHIRTRHSLEAVARRYWDTLCAHCS
jgi:glycosyltransferase involved in cell wall biosynthesis